MKLSPTRISAIDEITEELCQTAQLDGVLHTSLCDSPMPSITALNEFVERLKAIIFPGFFGTSRIYPESMRYHISASLDSVYRLLKEQIVRGGCFACADYASDCQGCEGSSHDMAIAFLQTLPKIRDLLAKDAKAAYEGDPAATSPGEAIFCYPSLLAMTHHRIAHELYKLKVPLIPRIIAEMAHSKTGIDIHPGAQIGEYFFIDHGTGVVIGETCVIGNNCRLYQGVTLGALSFPKEENGMLVKGNQRHPTLENNVVVYAGATILGNITIGHNCVIGGNVWVTEDVKPNSKLIVKNF